MSVHQPTLQALTEMGIEPDLARAAAKRFENADAAVNWCFGEGANWTIHSDPPLNKTTRRVPATPGQTDVAVPGTTVEHREVHPTHSESSSSHNLDPRSPPLPPRARPLPSPERHSPKPLGDKNPFRNSLKLNTNNPFTQPPAEVSATNLMDEDEELQRALLMSQEPSMDVDRSATEAEEEERDRAARKVRTSGPPPSPTLPTSDSHSDLPMIGPVQQSSPYFNTPSNQKSIEWDQPYAANQASAFPQRSKEDEELDKAIADSLMTASFHSAASAPPDDNTPQEPRQPGKPLVLYSPSGQTASANLLQGLLAIPQFRQVIAEVMVPPESSTQMEALRSIIDKSDDVTRSFMNVDAVISNIKAGYPGRELPPTVPVKQLIDRLISLLIPLLEDARESHPEQLDLPSALELFSCKISNNAQNPVFVEFIRDDTPFDTHQQLARALWSADSNAAILRLPDVLTMYLGWQPGYRKELWKLEKELVMDRYMVENAGWAARARAMQGLAEGNCKRLQSKINSLTAHEKNDIALTMANTIKHYEAFPGKDDIEIEHRSEIRAKLQQLQEKLQAKIEMLKSELESEEDNANGAHFETDDPKLNRYVYRLRAVLFHDGLTTGTGHLYMYLLGDDDQWWKIMEHEASPVDWSDVATDDKGKFMEGGPYCMLYERATPRPAPQAVQDQTTAVSENQEMARSITSTEASQTPDVWNVKPIIESSDTSRLQSHDVTIDEPAPQQNSSPPDLLRDENVTALPHKPEGSQLRPLPRPPARAGQRGDQVHGKATEDANMS